jgi:metal-responsive CopG/Arc/MetJ family transcriptional regulator
MILEVKAMSKMHRAQILLDPRQREELAEISQREGASISELVRSAVDAWLDLRREDEQVRKRLEALQVVQAHRDALLERRGGQPLELHVDELLAQARDERGAELLAGALGLDQDAAGGEP